MPTESGDDREELRKLLEQLHGALEATEELPVETTASRWIGEAQAVVADLVTDVPEPAVLADRLGHVDRLLGEVDPADHPVAEEHLRDAISAVEQLRDRLR